MELGNERSSAPEQIGPFTIVRRLGAGGMAEAFEGVRRGPGRFEQRVCIKRVLPGYATDAELVRLFMREARLAAALSHRNIARVLDFGKERGCYYLALELVEGMDLRRLVRALAPARLPLEVAALIGMELAEALEHAHTRSGATGPVVHRDVSPANTLLSTDGDVKLTDFGISKALNDSHLTRTDLVRGNIWYMAPEQLEGSRAADPRSDLFSLGIVLYEMLAGRRPYQGPNDLSTMRALSEGKRAPLRQVAPNLPEPMLATVDRLLASQPDARIQTGAEIAEALAPFASAPSARRVLAELVQDHRRAQAKRRAAAPVEPVTIELTSDELDPPEREAPSPSGVRPRWTRYAVAPGTWQSAERAAEQRRRENRPLPALGRATEVGARRGRAPIRSGGDAPVRAASNQAAAPALERCSAAIPRAPSARPGSAGEDSEVRLPMRSSLWWLALALTCLTGLGIAACAAGALG